MAVHHATLWRENTTMLKNGKGGSVLVGGGSLCIEGVNGQPILVVLDALVYVNRTDASTLATSRHFNDYRNLEQDADNCQQSGYFAQPLSIVTPQEFEAKRRSVEHASSTCSSNTMSTMARGVTVLYPSWQGTHSYHGIAGPSGLMQIYATVKKIREALGDDVPVHLVTSQQYVGRGEPSAMAIAWQDALLSEMGVTRDPRNDDTSVNRCFHAAMLAVGLTGRQIFYKEDLTFFTTSFVPSAEGVRTFREMRQELEAAMLRRLRPSHTTRNFSTVAYFNRPAQVERYPQGWRTRGMTEGQSHAFTALLLSASGATSFENISATDSLADQFYAARRARWVLAAEGAGLLWATFAPPNTTYLVINRYPWNNFDERWGRNFHSGLPYLTGIRLILVDIEEHRRPVDHVAVVSAVLAEQSSFEAGFIYIDPTGTVRLDPWKRKARQQLSGEV